MNDALSGPVASTLAADVTATDVATTGSRSKTLTGRDLAGNELTASCSYLVSYAFQGFLAPLKDTSIKRGSTVPVRFRLGDAGGATVPDSDAAALASACLVEVTFDATVVACASYDPVSDTFQGDIRTSKQLVIGAHSVGIRVRAATGEVVNSNSVTILIRK